MLSELEKIDFARSTIRPMAEYTMRFLTQVVGVIDENSFEHLGSGMFCEVGGRQAVVTAAHNLKTTREDREYVSIVFTRSDGEPPGIVSGKIVYLEDCDLAVYLPSKEFPIGPQKAFWPGNRIDVATEHAAKDYLFFQGFPGRFSRSTSLMGHALVSESLSYGSMMRLRSSELPSVKDSEDDPLPDDFLKPHQFAFNFEAERVFCLPSDDRPEDGGRRHLGDWMSVFETGEYGSFPGQRERGAGGLSGSPVWRVGASGRSNRDWSPDRSELVGFVTHWNIERKILIATSVSELSRITPPT